MHFVAWRAARHYYSYMITNIIIIIINDNNAFDVGVHLNCCMHMAYSKAFSWCTIVDAMKPTWASILVFGFVNFRNWVDFGGSLGNPP
jgi:hypothetical protein